jgi:hypothetical protein
VKRVLVVLVAGLVLAAPAQALAAPELYVRAQRWDTHEETGPWLPLASAPRVNYLGGYEIGFKLEASSQTVALTIVNVPDGAPTQPSNASPFCVARVGTVGSIVSAGPELQFEGNGTYTVKVETGTTTGTGCLGGPSTTGAFGVDVHVAPSVVGTLLRYRNRALPGDPFVGIRAADPPGGQADIRCTLGSRVIPDQSFSHPEVPEWVFPRPGTWTCTARGTAEGQDANRDTVRFGTPYSAPISVEVGSDFRYLQGRILKPRARRPKLTFRAEWRPEAQGGRGTVRLYRVTGCTRKKYKLRRAGTFSAAFGAKRVEIPIRRPRSGYFIATFAFGGTKYLRPMRATGQIRLGVPKGRLKVLAPIEFQAACTPR